MSEACTHPDLNEGYCAECGYCEHLVILNGECMACSRTDLAVTIKPDAPANVVPLASLKRKKKHPDD